MFRRIDHVEIVSGDPERTMDFYQNVLGFRLNMRTRVDAPPLREVVFLELGDTVIEVLSVDHPSPPSGVPWQVGFRAIVLEVENMEEAAAYFRSKGIGMSREPADLGPFIVAEVRDPDGLTIELREWK